jgi:hypothetical protein
MFDIKNKLYSPHAYSVIEIPYKDRILYISIFDNFGFNKIYDISYGLLEWNGANNEEEYLREVKQTSYRVIGLESLKAYLLKQYNMVDFDVDQLNK